MDDALAGRTDNVVTVSAVPFVEIDLARTQVTRDGGTITVTGAPTTITAEGSAAFPNYPAGTAFDPIAFSLTVTDCAAQALPGDNGVAASGASADAEGPAMPVWGWVLIGAVALLFAAGGSVVTSLVSRRRRGAEALR